MHALDPSTIPTQAAVEISERVVEKLLEKLICYAGRSTVLLGGHAYGSAVATSYGEFGFHLVLAF